MQAHIPSAVKNCVSNADTAVHVSTYANFCVHWLVAVTKNKAEVDELKSLQYSNI